MEVQDVFTPGDFPKHTYVEREQGELESRVEHQLRRRGAIISISGPSKSGKSVLVERVVGSENLVSVYGDEIGSVDGMWDQVLDSLGAPTDSESISTTTSQVENSARAGIRAHIFNSEIQRTEGEEESEENVEHYQRRGLDDVIRANEEEKFTLLIDDFHYMSSDLQESVGRAIKQASEEGLTICVALIPHKSDDLTEATPDLEGRALTLSLEYWGREDLKSIGRKGFDALQIDVPDSMLNVFANEAAGSPHLMQQLCYNSCGVLNVSERAETLTSKSITESEIRTVLHRTGDSLDLSGVFSILNGEGISGESQRTEHSFVDDTTGDVYESILRGIASDSVQDELRSSEDGLDRSALVDAIANECDDEPPLLPSITQALEKMDERISETHPKRDILEYDTETKTIFTPDPYLIFYLRWSEEMENSPSFYS